MEISPPQNKYNEIIGTPTLCIVLNGIPADTRANAKTKMFPRVHRDRNKKVFWAIFAETFTISKTKTSVRRASGHFLASNVSLERHS